MHFYLFPLGIILLFASASATAAVIMEPVERHAPSTIRNPVIPQREGAVDRPVSGDISEMVAQDSETKALRRRWYPYGYGYPYYPYYAYGGGGLDLELGLGLHL
ncbi:hypothetical protein GGI20_006306 [Coemansia sp. BCRC 34301]|nr:hypothetical protein GGI20_006306 [Coemansia sp. BCRC 34301]